MTFTDGEKIRKSAIAMERDREIRRKMRLLDALLAIRTTARFSDDDDVKELQRRIGTLWHLAHAAIENY